MLVQRLLDIFDKYTSLHIDVNDVRDQLIEMGVQDKIRFHFVKMDHSKVRGLLHRYITHRAPYSEPTLCSDIVIPIDMGDEADAWKRLVAVKELLHITDCDKLTAASTEAVDNLFAKFSVPPELRNGTTAGEPMRGSFLNDRVRIYFALAVLVPALCRDHLRPLFTSGSLSAREIAEIAQIPVRYVPTIMDLAFEELIGTFIRWELSEQPPEPAETYLNA